MPCFLVYLSTYLPVYSKLGLDKHDAMRYNMFITHCVMLILDDATEGVS
jgi:hypothetical protein